MTRTRQSQSSPRSGQTKTKPQPSPQPVQPVSSGLIQQGLADPTSLTPAEVLRLQRAVGNRAVQRLLAGQQPHGHSPRKPDPPDLPQPVPGIGPLEADLVQRFPALATTGQKTYQAESSPNENRVKKGFFGPSSTGHRLERYNRFKVADNAAPNDAGYFKITEAPAGGQGLGDFADRSDFKKITDVGAETKVIKQSTHLKSGPNSTDWKDAQYGDLIEVTGQTDDYYIAKNKRTSEEGSVKRSKVREHNDGLEKTNAPTDIYVATKPTTLRQTLGDRDKTVGASTTAQAGEPLQPGDKLKVSRAATGMDADGRLGRWWYAADIHDNKCYVDPTAVQEASDKAKAPKVEEGAMQDAVTLVENVPFHEEPKKNRDESIGVGAVQATFGRSGTMLKIKADISGIAADGRESLVWAYADKKYGYVAGDKVREVAKTRAKLEEKYGEGPNKTLTQVTDKVMVTEKTRLRQLQQNGDEFVVKETAYTLKPGVILASTADSRLALLAERAWLTDMLYEGNTLGLVDKEKTTPIKDDLWKAKPDEDQNLVPARVKADTHLRALVGVDGARKREHTSEIGDKTGPEIKAGRIVEVDLKYRGIDEQFSSGWVYAKYQKNYGYIREDKITVDETVGKATAGGHTIPAANRYVAKTPGPDTKVGDLFEPEANALEIPAQYQNLKNLRTNSVVPSLAKEKVILASEPLTKDAQLETTGIITQKTALHPAEVQPFDRKTNVGVSSTTGKTLQPGDKARVDFEAAGLDKDGDAGWVVAEFDNEKGYLPAEKMRSSSAELLAASQNIPDQFVPAYVIARTKFRDEQNRPVGDAKKPGELVEVNFAQHPPDKIKSPVDPNAQINNPYYVGAAEQGKWVKVNAGAGEERYIREYKVTVQSGGDKRKAPAGGNAPEVSEVVVKAAKLLSKGGKSAWSIYKSAEDKWNPPATGEVRLDLAGGFAGLSGLLDCVEALKTLVGSDRSIKQRLQDALLLAESGASGFAGGTSMAANVQGILKQDNSLATQLAAWAGGIASAITAVKELFLAIFSTWAGPKTTTVKTIEFIKHLLTAGGGGIKAAQFLVKTFSWPGSDVLKKVTPYLNIAIDAADLILGFRKWHLSKENRRLAKSAQASGRDQKIEPHKGALSWNDNKLLQAVKTQIGQDNNNLLPEFLNEPHLSEGEKFKNQLFWKEKRGVRSLMTGYKKGVYFRVNPKILFALRNQDKLDQRKKDKPAEIHQRSKEFISSDYYVEVDEPGERTGNIMVNFGAQTVKITPAAAQAIQAYEFASKVEEVSQKRQTLGGEELRSGFINLAGDVLAAIPSVAVVYSTMTKGAMAAINAGFDFARFLNRQLDTGQGKKSAFALKYKGQIKAVDKSQMQKKREYQEHAYFIMEEIGQLAPPDKIVAVATDPNELQKHKNQYRRVQQYIEMTGVNPEAFYELNGKPVEQVKLLADSLSER